jgi:hypothetical protein
VTDEDDAATGTDDAEPIGPDDEVSPVDEDDDRGGRGERRGSATSERVHEALTLDGELRPGDEGWGAAVSESARSGGHGERVSRAARGLDAPPAADPGDTGASAPRAEGPVTPGRGKSDQAPGQGGAKGRSDR